MPAATTTLLEDSAVDIDEWLAQEVDRVFAAQEGAAFVTGDGNNKPKGYVSYNTVANSSWTWGNIGYVASGVAGAFPTTAPSDVLVDLIFGLKAGYRQNAAFVMNRKTQSLIRKFKDTTNNYIWQPPASPSGRASLMNFPGARCRRHARHCREFALGGVRRFQARIPHRRSCGRHGPSRSLFRQALRAVLHDQARRRRRAGLRRDQAAEVRGKLIVPPASRTKSPANAGLFVQGFPHYSTVKSGT